MTLPLTDVALLPAGSVVAVGLSGGADSTALAHALVQAGFNVVALVVDHGLRAGSTTEAKQVAAYAKAMGCKQAKILKWQGEKPKTNIQENARNARYALLEEACLKAKITVLALGHHQDDQAETILFRLAKGTGVDGLAGMRPWRAGRVNMWRPLLNTTHAALVQYCQNHGLPWVEDPSNANAAYARVRLRASQKALAAEGMTPARLALTAYRVARACDALEQIAANVYAQCLENAHPLTLDWKNLSTQPEEVVLRVLHQGFVALGANPRLEALEAACTRLLNAKNTRKEALAGVLLSFQKARGKLVFQHERTNIRR